MTILKKPYMITVNARLLPIDRNDPTLVLYLPLWYPHGDMTGSTIYSYDKNHFACTVTNATWGSIGRIFDGTGDYLSILANANWNLAADFTILMWVYFDSVNRNLMKSVSNEDWNSASNGDWLLDVGGTNKVTLYVKGGETKSSTNSVSATTWTLISYSRISTSAEIGVNAAFDTVTDANGAIGNTKSLQIGRNEVNLDLGFDGIIGEVWFSNTKGLTNAETTHYYNQTKGKYL